MDGHDSCRRRRGIRKWRKADPEIYGIEIACMVRRGGEWRLITNFEDFRDRINKLDNETLKVFDTLEQYYCRLHICDAADARERVPPVHDDAPRAIAV